MRWGRSILIGAVAVAVAVVAVLAVVIVRSLTAHEPSFPSLAAHPDPSITGTVAYVDEGSRCVQVVAAAGAPVKRVYCLPAFTPSKVEDPTKEMGPQLLWRSDGRLEVTMFRAAMAKDVAPTYGPMWQKLIDVRTGAVEDVPVADVPASPDLGTRQTVSPSGQRIVTTNDRGHVKVALTDSTGSRTLMDVHGPSDYSYSLTAAFWSPDYRWVVADDGRILVITTGATPQVRVLTAATKAGAFGGGEAQLSRFAVTADNLLAAR